MSSNTAELPRTFTKTTPTRISLSERDFANGPVIISDSDVLVTFTENIEVNLPHPIIEQSPWHLGHYAALIVIGNRCTIDMKGFRLMMSPHMRGRNRFMSLIDLNASPLPPGKIGYNTPFVTPTDITIRNGTLAESAHFGIHNAGGGKRLLIENVRFYAYEVGAISISSMSDVTIRKCVIGRPSIPKTSALGAMMIDMHRECQRIGMKDSARRLAILAQTPEISAPSHTDSLCRCIVISNKFNVGLPPLKGEGPRIQRITLSNINFDDIIAEPIETVGISMVAGGEPIKDRFGNLVAHADALAASFVSRTQASLTPDMNSTARKRLMSGPFRFHEVHGLDVRAHELRQKASLLVRIDGADHVRMVDLSGGIVKSIGQFSAAVGYMLNACRNVLVHNVGLKGVEVTDQCVSSLSEERPQSGILLRQCEQVDLKRLYYSTEQSCACTIRDTTNTTMLGCKFKAPFTALRADGLHYKS